MTRYLDEDEIENILDFITLQKGIPTATAIAICESNKDRFRKQLDKLKIYPSIIPKLKEQLQKEYFTSLIDAGESVGIIMAQSIGEKNTQMMLNTLNGGDIWEKP